MKKLIFRKNIFAVFFAALNIILPLFSGLVLYLIFDPDFCISRLIYDAFPVPDLTCVREFMAENGFFIMLRNYFCDMCWAYSLECTVMLLVPAKEKSFGISAALCVCFSAAVEFLQLSGIAPGTFDPIDIICETLAVIAGGLVINFYFRRNYL